MSSTYLQIEEAIQHSSLDPREEYALRHFAAMPIKDQMEERCRDIPREVLLNRHLLNALLKVTFSDNVDVSESVRTCLVDYERENAVSIIELDESSEQYVSIRFRIQGREEHNNLWHTVFSKGRGGKIEEVTIDGVVVMSESASLNVKNTLTGLGVDGLFETEGGHRGSDYEGIVSLSEKFIREISSWAFQKS